jgi:hypothetical protein
VLRLSPTLSAILTDGSLYSQAASKILHDHTLINRTLGAVLRELSNADIEVRDADGQLVTEEMLISNPLHLVRILFEYLLIILFIECFRLLTYLLLMR